MASFCVGNVQLCGLELVNLDAAGNMVEGAGNLYRTDQAVSLSVEVELSEGDDLELKSGCGALLIAFADCDRIKRLNMGLSVGTPEPGLTNMLVPGVLYEEGGDLLGYGYPRVGEATCPNGVGVAAWVRNVLNGAPHPTYPYLRFVFPRVVWQLDTKELQNDVIPHAFTGKASENGLYLAGPADDYPEELSERIASYVLDTDKPDAVCGPQALSLAS